MAKLGRGRTSRRLWWVAGAVAAVSIVSSFGTPKAGCAGSADDEESALETTTQENDAVDHAPTREGAPRVELDAGGPSFPDPDPAADDSTSESRISALEALDHTPVA